MKGKEKVVTSCHVIVLQLNTILLLSGLMSPSVTQNISEDLHSIGRILMPPFERSDCRCSTANFTHLPRKLVIPKHFFAPQRSFKAVK